MKNLNKILVVLTFILMIVVNVLANALPINGLDASTVSDSYANLFAPPGITFSIWGIIFVLLAMFSFYQLGIINKTEKLSTALLNKVGILFIISSVLNAMWVFTWHYQIIPLSIVLMAGILICLIMINNAIKEEKLTTKEKIFVKLPFSVYFGWITVAAIANVVILLVSLNWNRFGISEAVWTVIILCIGAVIGILVVLTNKDYFYGLVIIWAYTGILIKHTTEFQSQYTSVIIAATICIALVLIADIYAFAKNEY